ARRRARRYRRSRGLGGGLDRVGEDRVLNRAEAVLGHANSCAVSFQATGAACRAAMSRRSLQYGPPVKRRPTTSAGPPRLVDLNSVKPAILQGVVIVPRLPIILCSRQPRFLPPYARARTREAVSRGRAYRQTAARTARSRGWD